ncbi:MAG: hypothetical protein NC401_13085, partial [Ruminococcus sp.]|nr:hypothetical protein [Ruminococcus sp.]
MSFTPSNVLQRALQTGDMYEIAGALIGYIDADPQFRTNDFDMALNYVLSNGVSEAQLFKTFDPSYRFEEDTNVWDIDDRYYSYARLYLEENFCRKRIEHVKAVARRKYPQSTSQPTNISTSQSRTSRQHGQTPKKAQPRQVPNKLNAMSPNPIVKPFAVS